MASLVTSEPLPRVRAAWAPLALIYAVEPVVAAAAFLAAAPLLLALAASIALLSRRCPLVRHRRVGWNGAPLGLLKFRTMWDRADRKQAVLAIEDVCGDVPERKAGGDPRVRSRFAAWCRRHSLDELPQLYHVVRGEMSFVGPRPITRAELDRYYGSAAREVLSLRPGLVGLWQVMGRNDLSYSGRRRLDLLLVRRACVRLYLRILLRAIPKVLSGDGAY